MQAFAEALDAAACLGQLLGGVGVGHAEMPRIAERAAVHAGDVLVAGKHFGQSSGRAVAPKALKATGIGAIVVEYASRLFYRNCFEIGLPLLECPGITAGVEDGDLLSVDVPAGRVHDETKDLHFEARAVDPFLMDMLEAGGLIAMAGRLAGEG